MPQLFSRMDDLNWVTPSISDILDQGAAPPGGDGSIREQMLLLQRKLGELDTPARVINVRPTPSFTMFIAKPDVVNWQGNRRAVTINEIKRSIGQIAEEKKDWKLGFLPQLQEVADTVGILLRTESHQPLSMRRLLVRTTFRNYPSTLAFAIGNTLEQQLVVHDLAKLGHMLIAGKKETRQHVLNNVLVTLVTLNTPGELRLVITGQSGNGSHKLVNVPHALGRVLGDAAESQRLLEGLVKEVQRRQQWFAAEQVDNLDDYNLRQKDQNQMIVPRIMLVIDSITDPGWEDRDKWLPYIQDILTHSEKTGVHMILTADQIGEPHVPEVIEKDIPLKILMRSAAGDLPSQLEDFHGSLTRFVDAFILQHGKDTITPVETAVVSQDELEKTVAYWREAAKQREAQTQATTVSGKTGVTGVLQQVPPQSPVAPSSRDTLETQKSSTETDENMTLPIQQAQALAAYLGWIGLGPLQDILGMTPDQARATLKALREMKIVENGTTPTPRFIRPIGYMPDEE